jgi:excinuclease UvrABC nuclease subunit
MSTLWKEYDPMSCHLLPDIPCVYCLKLNGLVVYVGSTIRLRSRFYEHKIQHGYAKNIVLPWLSVGNDTEITLKVKSSKKYGDWVMDEMRLIKKLSPIYNKMHKNPRKNHG